MADPVLDRLSAPSSKDRPSTHLAPWGVSDLQFLAESIVAETLDQAQASLPPESRSLTMEILGTQPAFCQKFKDLLASEIAVTLGACNPGQLAVYRFDPWSPMLHLLILVQAVDAGLEDYIDQLDGEIARTLHCLPLPEACGRPRMLDASLITPDQVRQGIGLAAMLTSALRPPRCIWQR
jgi:hypothetical protein